MLQIGLLLIYFITAFLRNGVFVMTLAGILIMLIMTIIQFPLIMRFLLIMRIIRTSVRPVVKCTIMYYEQTAKPISANFCTHMHVDRVHRPANIHPHRQRH